ncbi:MAG: hypothetical protein ACLT8C_03975 [Akkermansia muciniphila]
MTSRLGGLRLLRAVEQWTWLAQAEVSRTADYAGGWRLTPFLMDSRMAGRTPSGNRRVWA